MNKDKSLIPKGDYCYSHIDGKQVNCPYWSTINGLPEQESGYCSYLGYGDAEDNAKHELYDTVEKKVIEDAPGMSLLWDQCKECGENLWTDEDWEQMIDRGEVIQREMPEEVAKSLEEKMQNPRYVVRKKDGTDITDE